MVELLVVDFPMEADQEGDQVEAQGVELDLPASQLSLFGRLDPPILSKIKENVLRDKNQTITDCLSSY